MSIIEPRVARRDPRLRARVTSSRPLFYKDGADSSTDRPAHVRAASGICAFAGRLAIVQDDAAFIALLEPSGDVSAVTLPSGPRGARQFDDGRGNKADKPDLESCFAWSSPAGEVLVGLGSGSSSARDRVALVEEGDLSRGVLVDAGALYHALRADERFAGSELNLEGAVLLDDGRVRLCQRGNGAAVGSRLPVDATAHVDAAALLAFLTGSGSPPAFRDVVQWQLGDIDGIRLTFTDAASTAGRVLFLACAEDSPDAVRDGPVAGTAVGVFDDDDGGARIAVLEGREAAKAEGIVITAPGRGFLVLDPDDPDAPAELCELELTGPWT